MSSVQSEKGKVLVQLVYLGDWSPSKSGFGRMVGVGIKEKDVNCLRCGWENSTSGGAWRTSRSIG